MCRRATHTKPGHEIHVLSWEDDFSPGHEPGHADRKILDQYPDLRKRAALGSRTPDLRITSDQYRHCYAFYQAL
jgi:hypothetical protein